MSDGEDVGDQQSADIEEYNELTRRLDSGLDEFGGELIDGVQARGNVVYWLEYRDWDPTIHRLDLESGQRVNYSFPLSFDSLNYQVSEAAVAYAEVDGEEVVYHVFDSLETERELSTVAFESPTDDQGWWAYGLSGSDLFVVVTETESSPDTKLYRIPAGGDASVVTTLESAGCDVGEFWEFGVDGETVIFVESGRIWRLDLETNQATWLGNETEVSGSVVFDSDGVLFTTRVGPFFFDYENAVVDDLAEAIETTGFRLNDTFDSIHYFERDATWWGDYLIYVGNGGLFALNTARRNIVPILLEPRLGETSEVRVDYRFPVVTANGTLFVTGLESTSGSVGADGPVYRLDLADLLR